MSHLDLVNVVQKVLDPSAWLAAAEHLLVLV